MVALDGAGRPRAVLQTLELTQHRYDQVDEAFAFDEGEGDRADMVVQPDVAGAEVKEDRGGGESRRRHPHLDEAVRAQRVRDAVREPRGDSRPEREPCHEGTEHGRDRVHRDRQGERQESHPNDLVHETARAGDEEEDEEERERHEWAGAERC